MSAVGVEVGRPRPLSGGLWTLFSWLRRDEHSSSESLSSVGSDRTAASFAFLGPGHYTTATPLVIPPPGPPTDSYKKRVHDRNLRRQHDRDITLLRKYGLHGFDAFSLPNARRAGGERSERDRRAASELFQRRAHVPGKRRAPLPPSAPASLTRVRARKRPAPQPPLPIPTIPEKFEHNKDNDPLLINNETLPMNSQRAPNKQSIKHDDVTMGCKSEKYSKKDTTTKEVKHRQDKSFLKQIFENRKRNSAIETSSVKLLPSISELDKQAHEIIQKYKLKELEHVPQNGRVDNESPGSSKQVEAWICTRCLRKYNATVITCLYCLPLENALLNNSCKSSKVSNNSTQTNNSQKSGLEDKEKLKEILKEMKDSLPKKTTAGTSALKKSNDIDPKGDYPKVAEAATLRIGSSVFTEPKIIHTEQLVSPTPKINIDRQTPTSENTKDKALATIENVLVTQPIVLEHTKDNIVYMDNNSSSKEEELDKPKISHNVIRKATSSNVTKTEIASRLLNAEKPSSSTSSNIKSDINTPLKVSSLFNPIYIPKSTTTSTAVAQVISMKEQTETKNSTKPITTTNTTNSIILQCNPSLITTIPPPVNNTKIHAKQKEESKQQSSLTENIVIVKKIVETKTPTAKLESPNATSHEIFPEAGIVERLDQHSRRRNLINQLEQSIAKGDERAAAEAAVKLAQLRLSCSVLSFSSQIVAEASTSSAEILPNRAGFISSRTDELKTDETKTSQSKTENTIAAPVRSKESSTNTTGNSSIGVEKQDNISQTRTPSGSVPVAVKPKTETVCNKPLSQKKDVAVQNPARCRLSTARNTDVKKDANEDVPILVWVEDKETTRGPVQIHVQRNASLGDLRRQAEKSLGLAVRMQRWIIGRALCSVDNTLLVTLAGPELSAPFYLCLVESETKEPQITENAGNANDDAGNVYNELVKLEQQPLVSNAEVFECGVCMEECTPGRGVVLRECVHSFCNECLSDVVRHSEEPIVSCPAMGCRGVLQEREIKGLVSPEEYEKWLARGLAVAESGTRNAFHCRTRDCPGWALCEPGVRRFPCPVCKRTNCVPCQAIHEGESCEQHRVKLQATAAANEATNQTDEGTRALLDSLIARGEALQCPECSAIITKKWGCDWIKCSACKTEICWVTRGRRWGAAGRGDTSGGCRCGIEGKKCHPSCGYCH